MKAFFKIIPLICCPFLLPMETTAQDLPLTWEVGFVLDFFGNRNVDDTFPHYAVDVDSVFEATANETYLTFELGLGKRKSYDVTFGGEFNFMGPNDFQIFSAWFTLDGESHYITIGKIASLVGTDEMSLNYEAFNSTGTIRTGVKDNQHQVELGWRPAKAITFVVALSDEKADIGGMDGLDMTSDRPTIQAALQFETNHLTGKFAASDTRMELANGGKFSPRVLMGEVDLLFTDQLRLKLIGLTGQGGSQYFTQDNIFDYYRINDTLVEVEHDGLFAELIYETDSVIAWLGAGRFSTDDAAIDHFRSALAESFMKENNRVSVGIQYAWMQDLFIGLEYSRYETDTVALGEDLSHTGNSVQLQFKWVFSNQ